MPQNTKHHALSLLTLLLPLTSLVSLGIWLYIRVAGSNVSHSAGDYFALSLCFTPFIAGCFGFTVAKYWGGLKSLLGKAIFSLSSGLILWSLGNFAWTYYTLFKDVEAPYPSLADVGYGLGVLFWILSTIYLGRALGVGLLLRKKPQLKWIAAIFALASIALSYFLFVTVARKGSLGLQSKDLLKAFFDLYYPLTDVLSLLVITSVLIVSARYVGGLLRRPVIAILLGVFCSYIYDLTFSYYTTKGTYMNGQVSDIFLLTATVALSFSVVMFGTRAAKLQGKEVWTYTRR